MGKKSSSNSLRVKSIASYASVTSNNSNKMVTSQRIQMLDSHKLKGLPAKEGVHPSRFGGRLGTMHGKYSQGQHMRQRSNFQGIDSNAINMEGSVPVSKIVLSDKLN